MKCVECKYRLTEEMLPTDNHEKDAVIQFCCKCSQYAVCKVCIKPNDKAMMAAFSADDKLDHVEWVCDKCKQDFLFER